ncbi:MAG: NIL domain-containing protein, partial [Firmicutes bacterium]|nr:NIL domain-containing protein [Candidatus Scybalomonas excrementavium]
LVKKFDIEVNILYGNIDFLKGKPLGKLVISLAGTKEHIEEAMEYIRTIGVEMEVMRG